MNPRNVNGPELAIYGQKAHIRPGTVQIFSCIRIIYETISLQNMSFQAYFTSLKSRKISKSRIAWTSPAYISSSGPSIDLHFCGPYRCKTPYIQNFRPLSYLVSERGIGVTAPAVLREANVNSTILCSHPLLSCHYNIILANEKIILSCFYASG